MRGALFAKGPDSSIGGGHRDLAPKTLTSRFRQKKRRQEKLTEENKVRKKERTNNHSGA